MARETWPAIFIITSSPAPDSAIWPQMTVRCWSAGSWTNGTTQRLPHASPCRLIYWRIGCDGCGQIYGGRQRRLEPEGWAVLFLDGGAGWKHGDGIRSAPDIGSRWVFT